MGTGRSDDPFFDHFVDFLYDLMPNKFLACGSRPVRKWDKCPVGTCSLKRRTHTHTLLLLLLLLLPRRLLLLLLPLLPLLLCG